MDQPTPSQPQTPVPTPTPAPTRPKRSFSVWRIFFGAIIIFFGLQLLAANYGWDWSWSINVIKLWPVFIILIGLSMLMRGHAISTWLGGIIAVVIIAGAMVLSVTDGERFHRQTTTTPIDIVAETTATEAEIELELGAAKVDLTGGSTKFLTGTHISNMTDLTTSSTLSGTIQRVKLEQSGRGWFFFGGMKNTFDLAVADAFPLTLTMDSGASDLDLDLRTVPLKRFNLNSGPATVDLRLGDRSDMSTIDIDAGASTITVILPRSVGATVTIDGGATTRHLADELKKIDEDRYETDGYATATKKLDLKIDSGASTITVRFE